MIEKVGIKCTGCTACFATCPLGAITMIENNEGFETPKVDEKICTKCGLCQKNCPVLNTSYKNTTNPKCFAFMADDKIRQESASGGAFPLLAYHFLELDGYVAGAIWDKNWGVKHIVSNKKEDIELMRGSKYLQSSMENCYKEIKELLIANKKVLFTGTPCQVAGLKSFLSKDYENLYTAEIICHGTPSPKVFKKYLEENFDINSLNKIKFRSKKRGWGCGILEIESKNKIIELERNEYYEAFLKNVTLKKSCGECKFNMLPRQADITIGDFWGINKFNKKYNDEKGTSVILVNNPKGKILLEILNKSSKLLRKVPIKYAIPHNHNIINSSKLHPKRDVFFHNIDILSINQNVNKILDDNCDCMLINLWSTVNYGASLTCFGVKNLLEKLGKNVKVINYVPNLKLKYKNSFAENFAKKYLNLTKPIKSYEDLLDLNKHCKIFVAGSDQIFHPNVMTSHRDNVTTSMYLLDFVKSSNKKLSYAPSFGDAKFDANEQFKFIFAHFIKQFDALSVREDDGIDILKNDFNIDNAEQLIDGAFHIPISTLNDMTKDYQTNEKYIACYVLPYYRKNKWYRKYLKTISNELNLPIKELKFNPKTPLEEWIAFIKNAEFVISDSYHAIVFSIIFNKNFVQVKNATSQSRFESLFRVLNIENNSIDKFSTFDKETIFVKRNWQSINQNINKEILKAEDWMKKALETEKKSFVDKDFENFVIIRQTLDNLKYKELLKLIKNRHKYLTEYYFYKIFKNFCFGKKRKVIKEKIIKLKEIKREITKI